MADNDSYSDLTDESSGDEYFASQSQRAKSKKTRKGGTADGAYQIQNALKVPRATTYTAQSLYEQIQQADIDLDPEYQRAVVWPESKQIGLIDSIFRNFYIPPVIFAVKTFDDGTETRTCIDGKQRLTSIHRFMSGHIPHRDPITKDILWYRDDSNGTNERQKKALLPEKYRTLFANKQVVCVEYSDISDLDERDIFQRVQLGMALSPSEKLQVISSPKADFIRELLLKQLDSDSPLVKNIKWDRGRGNDFRIISQSVFIMDKWRNEVFGAKVKAGEVPKGTESAISVEKYLNSQEKFAEDFKQRIQSAYQKWQEIISTTRLRNIVVNCNSDGGELKLAPVEFCTAAVLIERLQDWMSLDELARSIRDMRKAIRKEFVDIRGNSKVCRTILEFIADLAKASSSNVRKRGRTSKASSMADDDDDAEDDDEDDGYGSRKRSRKASSSRVAMKTASTSPIKKSTLASGSSSSSRSSRGQGKTAYKDERRDPDLLGPSLSSNKRIKSQNDQGAPKTSPKPSAEFTSSRMQGIHAAKANAEAVKQAFSTLHQAQAAEGSKTSGLTPDLIAQLVQNPALPASVKDELMKAYPSGNERQAPMTPNSNG